LTEGWLNLTQAAQFVGTSTRTLRLAIERGEILAEKPIAVGPWLLNKQALQSESATKVMQRARFGRARVAVPPSSQATLDLSTT